MRRIQLVSLAVAGLCLAPAVGAQVHRCKSGTAFVFTDKPCEQGGDVVQAMPTGGSKGALHFEVVTRHYPVHGANLIAAYRSMRASSPDGFSGWARWRVKYELEKTAPVNEQCRVAGVKISVVGDILMPEWKQEREAPQGEQLRWRTMYGDLKRHEDGHVQHGREFGMLLKERLLGLGTMACHHIDAKAQQEYGLLYGNLNNRDKEYDRRTNHGLRQDNPE